MPRAIRTVRTSILRANAINHVHSTPCIPSGEHDDAVAGTESRSEQIVRSIDCGSCPISRGIDTPES